MTRKISCMEWINVWWFSKLLVSTDSTHGLGVGVGTFCVHSQFPLSQSVAENCGVDTRSSSPLGQGCKYLDMDSMFYVRPDRHITPEVWKQWWTQKNSNGRMVWVRSRPDMVKSGYLRTTGRASKHESEGRVHTQKYFRSDSHQILRPWILHVTLSHILPQASKL